MKSVRSMLLVVLAIVILGGVIQVVIPKRPAGRETVPLAADRASEPARPRVPRRSAEPHMVGPPLPQRPAPQVTRESAAPAAAESPTEPAQAEARATGSEQTAVETQMQQKLQANPAAGSGPQALHDPMARVALAFVGADPDAEAYWYAAINDPSLSAHERQDLIEDLNEDGLSDPRRPTMDDLPLILSRIELIEEVFWDSMDQVNADAFLEAYKDLVNLAFAAWENGS